ncbi:hypothetical protein PM10SUCC1_02960 [Propionigenium maris DSM 9537]|uniref:Trimeric autotransporter adhesin YadA-like C-terminal membrane anchor domain-containing protein n=1 Tax=Propionigenium maris DSM 9537 TaxID=1123000 RepID=A0A9W6LKZ6_9FUSO|nr:YadA-like family protein [Propionigenium maris]GLI54781.1 hypothetical protein PM10SUCC1_02960 [Propionigenium maris DSM 9537]
MNKKVITLVGTFILASGAMAATSPSQADIQKQLDSMNKAANAQNGRIQAFNNAHIPYAAGQLSATHIVNGIPVPPKPTQPVVAPPQVVSTGAVATAQPAVSPILTPTLKPNLVPNKVPMAIPTATPALTPTLKPTLAPTLAPNKVPTAQPTGTPVATPTIAGSTTGGSTAALEADIAAINQNQIAENKSVRSNTHNIESNAQAIKTNKDAIAKNAEEIKDNNEEAMRGVSQAMAMSAIKYDGIQEGHFSIGAGVGSYDDQTSVAVGTAYKVSDSLLVNAAVSGTDRDETFGYSTGVSYNF